MRENLYRFAFLGLMAGTALILGVNVVQSFSQKAPPPVTLNVMPKFMACIPSARPTIRMIVRIARHKANRHMSLSWTSPTGQSGLTLTQLDGLEAPEAFTIFRDINCADYVVQACLYRTTVKFCAPIEVVLGSSP